jgi:hypothetical protein
MDKKSKAPDNKLILLLGKHKPNLFLLILALILLAISLFKLNLANQNLSFTHIQEDKLPITIIMKSGGDASSRPLVLIAHGFSGSEVLMRGFSLTLAHAGYTIAAWDFPGHAANSNPLDYDDLLQAPITTLEVVQDLQLADTSRIAILGHSMGSGTALDYGLYNPLVRATIAISPVKRKLSSNSPSNILFIAGTLEPLFLENAHLNLKSAGGQGGDINSGTARKLVSVPNVEHISILFSPFAHSQVCLWLDQVFVVQSDKISYYDKRILWYFLALIGVLLLGVALSPLTAGVNSQQIYFSDGIHTGLILTVSAFTSTLFLWYLIGIGIPVQDFFGISVGGYLFVWFLIAGVVGWLLLRPIWLKPSIRELSAAILVFLTLWFGIGLLGHYVWLHWILSPIKLLLWILGGFLLLPWFYICGLQLSNLKIKSQVCWWFFQNVIILLAILLAVNITSNLSFLIIILPLYPIILAIHAILVSFQKSIWAYAISAAFFLSWLFLSVFPRI